MRVLGIIALAVIAMAVAACGGGGGGGGSAAPASNLLPATSSPLPAGFATANVTISFPTSSLASIRRAQTVGAGTQSIRFTLLQQTGASASPAPQTYGLTSASPGCVVAAGVLTCSLSINAPVGSDIFLAQTYSGTTGNGTLTGSGAVALSVALNATNRATLSLSAQIASLFLASSSGFLGALGSQLPGSHLRRAPRAAGTNVNSMRVFVIALDDAGNPVINPSQFDQPVNLELVYPYGGTPDVSLGVQYASGDTSASGSTSTSANYGSVLVYSPSDVITATLQTVTNGATSANIFGNIGSALIASPAPVPSAPPAGVGFLAFSINPAQAITFYNNFGQTYSPTPITTENLLGLGLSSNALQIDEPNFYGVFELMSSTCAGIATFSFNSAFDDYSYSYYSAVGINGLSAGRCSATFDDGNGNSATIPIVVTTTTTNGGS